MPKIHELTKELTLPNLDEAYANYGTRHGTMSAIFARLGSVILFTPRVQINAATDKLAVYPIHTEMINTAITSPDPDLGLRVERAYRNAGINDAGDLLFTADPRQIMFVSDVPDFHEFNLSQRDATAILARHALQGLKIHGV